MKKPRILIVEDEFVVALEIAAVLTDADFEVLDPAATVEDALQVIGSEAIDAAVLDCNLGGRNVEDIASNLSKRQIPFVFVTGYGPETLPDNFQNKPLVPKPFDERRLVGAVRLLLQNT